MAIIFKWFLVWERGLATGLVTLLQYLGIVIAMVVTPLLVQSSPELANYGAGFKNMLLIYGVISLVASVIAVKNDPPSPPGEKFERFQYIKKILSLTL